MDFMQDRTRAREEGREEQNLEPPKQKQKLNNKQQTQQQQQQTKTGNTKTEIGSSAAGALTTGGGNNNNNEKLAFLETTATTDLNHHHHPQHHHQQHHAHHQQQQQQKYHTTGGGYANVHHEGTDKLASELKLQIYVFQYKLQKEVNCVKTYSYPFDNVDNLKEFIKTKCMELQPTITEERMNQYVEIRDTSKKTKMNVDGITQAVVKKFRKKHQTMKVHIYKNGKTYTRKEYIEEQRMTDDKPESALNIAEKVSELKKRHPQYATQYEDEDIWKAWALEIVLSRHDIERSYYMDHMPTGIVQLCKSHDIIQHLLATGGQTGGQHTTEKTPLGVSKMMHDIQNANSDLTIAIESTLKKHTHHVTQALKNLKPPKTTAATAAAAATQ